jgi:hypothetical protein
VTRQEVPRTTPLAHPAPPQALIAASQAPFCSPRSPVTPPRAPITLRDEEDTSTCLDPTSQDEGCETLAYGTTSFITLPPGLGPELVQ